MICWLSWMEVDGMVDCFLHWKTFSFSNYGIKGYRFSIQSTLINFILQLNSSYSIKQQSIFFSLATQMECFIGVELEWIGPKIYNPLLRNSKLKVLMEEASHNSIPLHEIIPQIQRQINLSFHFVSLISWIVEWNWWNKIKRLL